MDLQKLLSLPSFYLGYVDEDLVKSLHEKLPELAKESEVVIVIGSTGGYNSSARALYEQIQYLSGKTKVYGLVMGVCHSNAITAFMAIPKEQRFATQNSQFYLHQTRNEAEYSVDGPLTAREELFKDMAGALTLGRIDQEWIMKVTIEGTGNSLAKIKELMLAPTVLNAQEGVKVGLAQRVV